MIRRIDKNSEPTGKASAIARFFGLPRTGAALLAVLIAATTVTAACGGINKAATQKPLRVVTTTALLADLAQNVAGGSAVVSSVIPAGTDVHSFQTTPSDSIDISNAGLIISNGGGLDDFLNPMIDNALGDGAVHVVTYQGLEDISSKPDPHYWQNPANVVHYVRRIRNALSTVDPANAESYRARAVGYVQQLSDLDREISQILEEVPPSHRHLVTYHDAFAHFGEHYGWRTSSLVANDAGSITPAAITQLQELVLKEGITAVFTEPQFRSKVIDLAAQDYGLQVGTIHSDILVDGPDTYVDMMRFNAHNLVEMLR